MRGVTFLQIERAENQQFGTILRNVSDPGIPDERRIEVSNVTALHRDLCDVPTVSIKLVEIDSRAVGRQLMQPHKRLRVAGLRKPMDTCDYRRSRPVDPIQHCERGHDDGEDCQRLPAPQTSRRHLLDGRRQRNDSSSRPPPSAASTFSMSEAPKPKPP